MNNTFDIICIRVLEQCAPYIKKVLGNNTTYFFQDEYIYDENTNWIKPKNGIIALNEDFFNINLDNEDTIKINISAIVGQNGDGKSSIVELILRILNNFAYASGYSYYYSDLIPVKDVWAELFYRINGVIYAIKCHGDNIVFYKGGISLRNFSIANPQQDFDFLKENVASLFYTSVSNYSLYSYNSNDLTKEYNKDGKCWIESIFHKNDGYQTPVVLNPYRIKGNIDINKENFLSKQRLMAMFVDGSIKEINKNERSKGFAYKLENKSKLITKSIKDYMNNSHEVLEKNFKSDIKQFETIPQKNPYDLLEKHYTFWEKINECMNVNMPLFKIAYDLSKGKNENQLFKRTTLFTQYVYKLRAKKDFNLKLFDIINLFTENNLDELDYSIIHRILIIHEIQKLWDEKFKQLNISENPFYDIEQLNSVEKHAALYITYKTLDILETYEIQYNSNINSLNDYSFFLDGKEAYNVAINEIRSAFDLLLEDIDKHKSHITLKLRQTLNFLLLNNKYKYLNLQSDNVEKISDVLYDSSFKNYIDFYIYNDRISSIINEIDEIKQIELLPPPIFDVEIIIEKGKDIALLSSLSSGERQLLNSISGIAYHLRNIDNTIISEKTIGYEFVNLIFEEVELYFHPEFQQKYILSLISILSGIKFKRLKAINMCFVTHSPFILSDIPKRNVLFLKDGLPSYPMQEDTFGANIHTLLHNGFFLSNVPIGDFARNKINKMFEKLHRGIISDELYNEILLVSEPFLKSQLLKLYKQYKIDSSEEINMLRKEIEELKKRIN